MGALSQVSFLSHFQFSSHFTFNYEQLYFCSKLVTFLHLQATFQYGNPPEFKNGVALFSMLVVGKGLEKSQPCDVSHLQHW